MAIRLRRVGGQLIAICAARSVEKPGDVYLDDEQHHALGIKFDLDLIAGEGRSTSVYDGTPEAQMIEREESDNPARTWWETVYGQDADKMQAKP